MKSLKKLLFIIILIFAPMLVSKAFAHTLEMYPIYGYNATDHICQIKQESASTPALPNLSGEYWNIRECRSSNPEIIFYTGSGIIIWMVLVIFIFSCYYFIFPRMKKFTPVEKKVGVIFDISMMGMVLFFLTLLQHFYAVPYATYQYSSDLDNIIYDILIKGRLPLCILGVYVFISLVRGVILWRERK